MKKRHEPQRVHKEHKEQLDEEEATATAAALTVEDATTPEKQKRQKGTADATQRLRNADKEILFPFFVFFVRFVVGAVRARRNAE